MPWLGFLTFKLGSFDSGKIGPNRGHHHTQNKVSNRTMALPLIYIVFSEILNVAGLVATGKAVTKGFCYEQQP